MSRREDGDCTVNEREWAESRDGMAAIAAPEKKKRKSMRLQTWTYFFLLAIVALFVLWGFQMLFYKAAYRTMKKDEVTRLGKEIAEKYPGAGGDKEYRNFLHDLAVRNGLNVVVFNIDEIEDSREFRAEYMASQFNVSDLGERHEELSKDSYVIPDWDSFYLKICDKDNLNYISHGANGDYIVYGANLDNSAGKYLYISSPYQPVESTVLVLTNQLLIASIICLGLCVILSFFISSRVTQPITEFSRVAEKLSAGDYTVRFRGNGYAEMETLADTLNKATEEFGKTEQMRKEFLANVSHDLRTPLTMVKAYAEMIRDISGGDEAKRTQHSQVIVDEADRLAGLVNDILNLSKLQSGAETLSPERTDISALTNMVAERFGVYSERDGYVFDVQTENGLFAYCDAKRIEQVIYNLIGNAVSYTGESKTVQVRASGAGGKVRVSVRDFGKGIAPEELDKVWERYYRANQHKRAVVGSGLGLSIVKSILVAHGAHYGVSSAVGSGTEFWFELDAMPASEAEEPLPALSAAKKTRRRLGRRGGGEKN